MAKKFGFLGFTLLLASAMVSSTTSARPTTVTSRVTFYYHTIGDWDFTPFVSYTIVADFDCQVIDIPHRPIAYPEIVEVLQTVEPAKVLAVAHSPPA